MTTLTPRKIDEYLRRLTPQAKCACRIFIGCTGNRSFASGGHGSNLCVDTFSFLEEKIEERGLSEGTHVKQYAVDLGTVSSLDSTCSARGGVEYNSCNARST